MATSYGMQRIRCEDCGNEDPDEFHRIHVEEAREKLVDGEWTVVAAWKHAGGQETHTVCEDCGSSAVDERQGPDERPSGTHEAARLLAESLAPGGPLAASAPGPERGALRLRAPGGEIFGARMYREAAATAPSP